MSNLLKEAWQELAALPPEFWFWSPVLSGLFALLAAPLYGLWRAPRPDRVYSNCVFFLWLGIESIIILFNTESSGQTKHLFYAVSLTFVGLFIICNNLKSVHAGKD
jgi:hypothetical protein